MQCQFRGDRNLFCGVCERDLLESVREHHPYPEADLNSWMASYAKRMLNWNGTVIRTEDPKQFIEDLRRAGEMRVWGDYLSNASAS